MPRWHFLPARTRRKYWNTGTHLQDKALKLEHQLEHVLEHGFTSGTRGGTATPEPREGPCRRASSQQP
jgi:hypothetical protein